MLDGCGSSMALTHVASLSEDQLSWKVQGGMTQIWQLKLALALDTMDLFLVE